MILLIVQVLIFASVILSGYMIVVTLERCRSEKRYTFVYCLVTLCLYNLGYFIEISSGNLEGAIVGVKITYAGGCFMAAFFFFFVADYCETRIPKTYYRIPLLIVPILLYAVVFTFDRHKLLYNSYYYDLTKSIPDMEHIPGPLYMVGQLYPVFCVILSCIVLVRKMVKQSRGRRLGLVLLLISAMAPLIAHLAYLIVLNLFGTSLLFTAFLTILSNFIFYYNIVRNDMFDIAPKAHAITMDLIRDSFVVLDRDMAYTGSNKKAQELFPALAELPKGASIHGLEGWPEGLLDGSASSSSSSSGYAGTGINLSIKELQFTLPHKPGKIYSGWTNPIASEAGATLGWVVLIQNITETVSLIRNIKAQRDEIAAMRDNLEEGIFLMDREYTIQDSYSRAMEEILSVKNLQGRLFTDLLSRSYSPKDLATVADYFAMLMDKSVDSGMLEEINPLGEFSYTSGETMERKTLRCRFAPVDQGNGEIFVMGTIQDITAETILKKQLAEEEALRQEEMRSLFEVIQVDPKVLGDFIEDADYEFNRAKEIVSNNKIPGRQKLINIYQEVHSIKSNALIVGLTSLGGKLHDLEEEIKTLREKAGEPKTSEIVHIAEELEKHGQEREKLHEIVKRLRDFSASTAGGIMKDDEVFLEALKQAGKRVAKDELKKAEMVVKTFDREALNRGPRRVMKDILIQLVRNSVHHGIETPEERLAQGKDETGKISLSVTIEDAAIRMILEDDGRGLDLDAIAEKAKEQGLLKNLPADKINKQFLYGLIFNPGFSTSATEDIHAGRGIGLNLVKDRLREVNGKIAIKSNEGQGLAFDIQIPYSAQ